MTAPGVFISSLIAMRHLAALEILLVEAKRHTHVLRNHDFEKALLNYIALETFLMHIADADVSGTASLVVSIASPAIGTITVEIGDVEVASVATTLLSTPEEIAEAISDDINAHAIDLTASFSGATISITAPPSLNGAQIVVDTPSGIRLLGSTEICGGIPAGMPNAAIAGASAICVYEALVAHFVKSACCDTPIELAGMCYGHADAEMQGPTAKFAVSVAGATEIDFDGDISINRAEGGDASTLIYAWDFGDGDTAGPTQGLSSVSHDYGVEGTFTVCLTVTDENGKSHKTCEYVVVSPLGGIGVWTIGSTFIVA